MNKHQQVINALPPVGPDILINRDAPRKITKTLALSEYVKKHRGSINRRWKFELAEVKRTLSRIRSDRHLQSLRAKLERLLQR